MVFHAHNIDPVCQHNFCYFLKGHHYFIYFFKQHLVLCYILCFHFKYDSLFFYSDTEKVKEQKVTKIRMYKWPVKIQYKPNTKTCLM